MEVLIKDNFTIKLRIERIYNQKLNGIFIILNDKIIDADNNEFSPSQINILTKTNPFKDKEEALLFCGKNFSNFDLDNRLFSEENMSGKENIEMREKLINSYRFHLNYLAKLIELRRYLTNKKFQVNKYNTRDTFSDHFGVGVILPYFDYEKIRDWDFFENEHSNYRLSICTIGLDDKKKVFVKIIPRKQYKEELMTSNELSEVEKKLNMLLSLV